MARINFCFIKILKSKSIIYYPPSLNYFLFSVRRFRFGTIGKKKVILVMTGLSMVLYILLILILFPLVFDPFF